MAIAAASAQARGVRAIAICAVLAGCGRPEATSAARGPGGAAPDTGPQAIPAGRAGPSTPAGSAESAPGPRLPDGVAPVSYDLTLELDPARETFTGHVAIAIAVAAPGTARLWLHAVDLEIASAKLADHGRMEDVALLEGGADSQMRGFALPHPVGGETITLVIDYTGRVSDLSGRTGKDEEGVFRERAGGRWYLYSQSESIFARKIVPCFDEPRWKPAWRVTAIVPRDQVALANAPMIAERALPGGRREVRFAEIAALPSYLLAVAVGPFDIVEAGKLGRAHTPVRLAVLAGDARRVALARRELPRIIDALESYLDAPLPLGKLDLVAVPRFFGAMENAGLITFETTVLVGGRDLVTVIAHELAHQWFGNSVTPAWWEHLWLSEAFATWLGERVTASLGARPPPVLAHRSRAEALSADDQIDARPLVHPIATSGEIEPAFDAIAYEKGAAVLATFERFAGSSTFQAAVRAYLAAHAGTSVTSQAFLDALAAATDPATGAALASNLVHAGTPVVELALRCGAQPAIVASARDGVTVPVCVRFPVAATAATEASHVCFLAGAHVEQPLPAAAGCPAWVVGNDGGRGYYRTVWRGVAPAAPLARLSPDERLARGDDAALAVRRGELALADALVELTALAMTRDPYGELAALSIARAIDPLVPDSTRPAWAAWLAGRFADRLTSAALSAPRSVIDYVVRGQVVELSLGAIDRSTLAAVRAALPGRSDGGNAAMLRIAAARDAGALFDRVVEAAATARTEDARGELIDDLGAFPAGYAPRVVDVLLDPRFAAALVWPALAEMLERGDTRTAAWHAIHERVARLVGALAGARARDVIAATGSLCDATARAEVAADFTPRLAAIGDGKRVLGRALAAIDRCIARRAAAGDVANALAARPVPAAGALTPRP
jgi:alanyl aminopeptidase